ncbi:T9SS type A sorting domain-containing protein [Flammeovirga sp. SubArs3]|uniref:VPS10 domain-containing protein n=1 Tax=Flammeovirga sp. SubArs3 TaxID=2995316 RepID=UPI00248C0ABB|nr:T9SS type A sorting domain-containing protein [Flammeovirga sp. SubArs3]
MKKNYLLLIVLSFATLFRTWGEEDKQSTLKISSEAETLFFSGFEGEISSEWESNTYNGLTIFEKYNSDQFEGNSSCRIQFNATNQKCNFTSFKNIKWEEGKVYKISFYYKALTKTDNQNSNIKFFSSDDTKIGQVNLSPLESSEWVQVKFSFTPSVTDENGYVLFSFQPHSEGKGELLFDNFLIKKLGDDFFQELKTTNVTSNPNVKWSQFGPGMSGNNKVAFWHSTDENTLFIGPNMGNVYRTTDQGETYESMLNADAKGMDTGERGPRELYSIDFSRQNPDFGFATDRRNLGIYKTINKGKSWELINGEPFEGLYISCVSVDPNDEDTWYAGGGKMRDFGRVLFPKSDPHGTYIDPNSQGKIWKSTDKGQTWTLMNQGLHEKTEVETILVNPKNSLIVFASTNRGFYKSTDGGKNWVKKTNGFDHDVMRAMAYFHNTNTNKVILFVINDITWKADGKTVTDGGGGIFKSTDHGESWTKINGDLALDLTQFEDNSGIKKSYYTTVAHFFGISYNEAVEQYPELPTKITQRFNTIEVDPNDVDNIYLNNEYSNASKNNFKPGQLWRSKDGGEHWYITLRNGKNWESNSPDKSYWENRGNPMGSNITLNYLKHWMVRDDYERKGTNFARFSADGKVLHANMAKVSLMSYDKGDTWVDIDDIEVTPGSDNFVGAGNSNLPGHGFFQHPDLSQVYCLAGENSLWITNDEGNHIREGAQAVQYKSLTDAEQSISSYAIDPHDTDKHYALFFRQHHRGECLRSLDGGDTWEAIGTAIPEWDMVDGGGDQSVHQMQLTIDPNDTENLYFCVPKRANNIEFVGNSVTGFGVHRSTDGGVTWEEVNSGLPNEPDVTRIALHPENTSTIFACVQHSNGGLFKSENQGTTWTEVASTSAISKSFGINDIHFSDNGKVYITSGSKNGDADDGGLWVSEDNMESWSRIFDYPWTNRVEIAKYDPNVILVSTLANTTIDRLNAGLYLSKDAGDTWEKINTGNGQSDRVNDIAIDQFVPGKYYASTYGSGWYMALNQDEVIQPELIYFEEENIELRPGATKQLKVVVYPENAYYQGVELVSEDETIASITSTGKVKGKAEGNTKIYARIIGTSLEAVTEINVVEEPVNLPPDEGINWVVYPNPTTGKIYIKGNSSIEYLEKATIYNLSGQIQSVPQFVNNNKLVINSTSLAKGMYILNVETASKIYQFKFLKE